MIAKRRWIARMLLVIALVLVGLAAVPAQATPCVGIDLTVTVLGQPRTLLSNGCPSCFITQGPNTVWTNAFGLPMTSIYTNECIQF